MKATVKTKRKRVIKKAGMLFYPHQESIKKIVINIVILLYNFPIFVTANTYNYDKKL